MSHTPILKKNPIPSRTLLIEGTKLGIIGVFWGSFLFLFLYYAVEIVPAFLQATRIVTREEIGDFIFAISGFLGIGFLVTFFVSIIPATLAGFTNTQFLISIARAGKLSTRKSLSFGIVVGCFFCLIPTWLGTLSIKVSSALNFNNPPSRAEEVRDMITIVIISMVTAALVGSWHSLKMYRFLASPV